MRAVLAVMALVGLAFAGCGAPQEGTLTFSSALARADAAAQAWDEGAVLIDAYAIERSPQTPIPSWLQDDAVVPRDVKTATDDDVGDGEAAWWLVGYQARMTSRKALFAVGDGTVVGPLEFQGEVDDGGSALAETPVGDVQDPRAIATTLRQRQDWPDVSSLVTWELFRHDADSAPLWLATTGPETNVTAAVDATTGSVVCLAFKDDISFHFSRGVVQGMVNAVQPDEDRFVLADGHAGLRLELSSSDEALNRVEATITSPDGTSTVLETTGGAPTVADLRDPPGGEWTVRVTQPSGAAASYVLRFETTGALVQCG